MRQRWRYRQLRFVAVLNSTGTIDASLQNGLSVKGDVDAQYRTPPGSPRPYEFKSSLDLGAVNVTPSIRVTTPEIVLVEESEVCVPFFGCITIPGEHSIAGPPGEPEHRPDRPD
ncbi:MAG: hypothetical protein IPG06_02355 [Haliea sp.]|nr:hypothetical protein [Haliea sp.]